ncbi:MAG: VTT domain-containing protein [Tatlockia sp.]|nr:VTT domain-containing protein [Tatlockia sp.]
MHLFSDYIQPLTVWLYDHPHLALLIAFFISFAESLAIIGSIVPGSVTMTAVGILAGAGVMRIDLTLLAATLGAIAGDGVSYMLGYIYSERLTNIWPFKRYPTWLAYGKDYFARHGGKSVLIGRFVGPLRSIIPVIAGMMHMSHLRFYIANIISAIGWSLLYIMPGFLIGTASSELSPESATRLFVIILFILVAIWLISIGLKWLFIRANRLLSTYLQKVWLWAIHKSYLRRVIQVITPANEKNHYSTAILFVLFILATLALCLITVLVVYGDWIDPANQSIHLFFQSLRTNSFDAFFIILLQLTSPLTLITLVMTIIIVTIYYKEWRSLAYWISLCLFSVLVLLVLHLVIDSPRPQGLLKVKTSSSFPIPGLTLITAIGVSLFLYIDSYSHTRFKHSIKIAIASGLLLLGLSPLYLGDNWLSDILGSYLFGLSLSLGHWLLYRRIKPEVHYPPIVPLTLLGLLFLTSALSSISSYKSLIRGHQPYFALYVFSDELWWNQTKPLLPIYRTNRIGNRSSLFNLQYTGSLMHLESALASYGWQKEKDSVLNTIITRVNDPGSPELPLMSQLYLNKRPVLVMIYEPSDGSPVQILRIWRSNYYLEQFKQPIWLGSIHPRDAKLNSIKNHLKSIKYISDALTTTKFSKRSLRLPAETSKLDLAAQVEPQLLLVRETTEGNLIDF